MKKIVLVVSLASLLFATQQPYEVSVTVGGTKAESDLKLDDHANLGIRLGIENGYILEKAFDTIEFMYERSSGVDYDNTILETDVNRYAVNFIHSYTNFENFVPYGLVGIGYEDFSKEYLKANDSVTANLGLGVKYFINDVVSLRAEVRDQINLEHSVQHEMIYSVGLGYSFGNKSLKEPLEEKEEVVEKPIVVEPILVDSDKDGVYDKDDKCPSTLKGFSVDSDGCPVDYNLDINFDTDKYTIKEQYNNKLSKFVDFINMMSHYKVEISGHTDTVGNEKYNQSLSEKRAKAVMEKLIDLGIDKERLTYKGYGGSNPISSNETNEGREQNRRVEATILK